MSKVERVIWQREEVVKLSCESERTLCVSMAWRQVLRTRVVEPAPVSKFKITHFRKRNQENYPFCSLKSLDIFIVVQGLIIKRTFKEIH